MEIDGRQCQFADGRKRETWGADPQGMLIFNANGTFMLLYVGVDRPRQAGTIPADPVGPLVAMFGTYTADAANNTVEYHVQRASWPQWDGATLKRTILELSPTTVKIVSAPINYPKGGGVRFSLITTSSGSVTVFLATCIFRLRLTGLDSPVAIK